jgi:5-methyltetrahydrofolate--homocysteine methyltransferase
MENGVLRLISEEFVVLDGAFGTLLQERGYTPDQLPEEWNVVKPESVRDIHLEYFKVGAQIVTTNTFGASPLKLGMRDMESFTVEANRRGVQLVREALEMFRAMDDFPPEERNEARYIGGSIGPCGKLIGLELSHDEVKGSVLAQAEALEKENVDLFLVETMMDLSEAELIVRTLKGEMDRPVVVSMVFNRTKDGSYKTLFGNSVDDSVRCLVDAGADAVGTNCGLLEDYVHVIAQMRKHTKLPLVLYPNAGIPKLKAGVTQFEITPDEMMQYLGASVEAGASIIGGCCGTTPEYIGMLAKEIKHRKRLQ